MTNEWGPLWALAGEWEGEGGLDTDCEVTITVRPDSWSYDEISMLRMSEFTEPFPHSDHNTLRRVACSGGRRRQRPRRRHPGGASNACALIASIGRAS
jgi:hypothetical protein